MQLMNVVIHTNFGMVIIKMAEVKVLIKGKHARDGDKLIIGSTVTLVKSDKNIIVDTGSFGDDKEITEELKKENLSPGDIDIVVLTHLHLDHIVNVNMFPNAKIYCKFINTYPGQAHNPKGSYLERTEIVDGTKIAEDVTFLLAHGHSNDMVVVVVKTEKGKIIVAGDAVPNEEMMDLSKHPPEMVIFDINQFNESRKKIIEIADYIVPGHGDIFKVEK